MKKLSFIPVLILFITALRVMSQQQTIVYQPGPNDGYDAAVRTDHPNQNYGDGYDFIANAWTAQGNFFIMRSFIRFDFNTIPANATIINATLDLFTNETSSHYQLDSGQNQSFLIRVISDWQENQITWNNQPSVSTSGYVILPKSTSNTQTYHIDLTNHVQDMVSHPTLNFGWMFRLGTEERYRCLVFASSDHPNANWHPRLTVTYTVPFACGNQFTDKRDGTVYNSILVGNQCWMQQNLNYGIKVNGRFEQTNNSIPEKYCYNNLDNNCSIYGGLYQWGEMLQYINGASNTTSWNPEPSGNIQGICPSEWHIPSDQEWCILTTFLDNSVRCSVFGMTGTNAGGKLKEKGISHWVIPNTGATNESMFFALPGGARETSGTFSQQGYIGGFWTLSQYSSYSGINRGLSYNTATINRSNNNKANGFSVRCVKDCLLPTAPTPGTHIPSPTQIIWIWNPQANTNGYKWSDINDYDSAIDVGTNTSYTETGLSCNTNYTRYIWAYAYCGHSPMTTLTQSTVADAPVSPTAGTQIPSPTQIVWNWNSVSGSTGYRWNTTNNFDNAIEMGINTTYTEQSLICNTLYTRYIWAYNGNCGYSSVLQLVQATSQCPTFSCGNQFLDNRDNKVYSTIQIGTQCWMKKNLNFGSRIDGFNEQTNNGIPEKYCYGDDESNCDVYGGLYEWAEAVQYYHGATNTTSWNPAPNGDVQGVCPHGWHIPKLNEYSTLVAFLGGVTNSGYQLKEMGTIHWNDPNNASNSSEFTALGSGIRVETGIFYMIGNIFMTWSSTEFNAGSAWDPDTQHHEFYFHLDAANVKQQGFPVRCLKD